MKLKILNETENHLYDRKEVAVVFEANVTPSLAEAQKIISDKFSTKIKNIKIKKIYGEFGSRNFTITANIYQSKEDKEAVERKSKKELALEKKEEQKVEEKPVEDNDNKTESDKPNDNEKASEDKTTVNDKTESKVEENKPDEKTE